MRLFTRVGYRPKRIETKEQSDGLLHLLALSVVGLCACLICLCGASWAWFTATTSTGTTAIQAAKYSVGVSAENESVKIDREGGTTTFTFPTAGRYTVKLTPNGTAKNGYCKIEFAGGTYYTGQLPSGELSFTVNAGANSKLTVTPQWGTCTRAVTLNNEGAIGNTPETADNTADMPAEQMTISAAPSHSLEESAASTPDAPADPKTAQPESVTGGEQAPAPEDSNR